MKPTTHTLGLALLLGLTVQTTAAADDPVGKAAYERICAACHLPGGEGLPAVFPPLKKSDYFRKASNAQLVRILTHGLNGPVTVNGQTFNSAMPPVEISDEEATAVLNYVSVSLNGGKPLLKAGEVKKLRGAK